MNGCVIAGTPIAVDFWRPIKAPQARLFFLTHFHADHIQGLTSSWRIPLYTSIKTALLVKRKFKLPDDVVHQLEVGESYSIPLDKEANNTITVTVLDANHVPGAVMFLFQGYFGNILYCGDMRWSPGLLEHPLLQCVVQNRELDVLYLDNTYSAPHCKFPSREIAKQQLFKIIDEHADHMIKIGIRNLGREDLLEEIALKYHEKILVTQDKYEQLQLLGYRDAFTTNPKLSRIHAVPVNQIQGSSHGKWSREHPTVSIILSAMFVGWVNGPYSSQSKNGIFVVPYSDHSSYPELMEMVSRLAPRQVRPIVQSQPKAGWWSDPSAPDQKVKTDMSVYCDLLTSPPPGPVVIPEAVASLMDAGAPRQLQTRSRHYFMHRGLSSKCSKIKGVVYSSPEPPYLLPLQDIPAVSDTTVPVLSQSNGNTPVASTHKREIQKFQCSRIDNLVTETTSILAFACAKLSSQNNIASEEELSHLLKDSKLLLESLSCISSFYNHGEVSGGGGWPLP